MGLLSRDHENRFIHSCTGAIGIKTVFLFLLVGLLAGFLGHLFVDTFRIEEEIISHPHPVPAPLPATPPLGAPPSFADLASSVSSAVVNINTTKTIEHHTFFENFYAPFKEFFGQDFWDQLFEQQRQRKERSLGSGFIVAEEGYIVTNAHLIEGADEISIRLATGKTVGAEIVGIDEKTDLALMKVQDWKTLPPPVPLGDSDALRVGDWVIAIGNPFGLNHTVTAGIVSAKGRVIGSGPYDDFIQTDASINPGNSGGPLFNINGEVVGINTSIFTTSGGNIGIGFAVPINMARTIIAQLKEAGMVTRGWLGISVQQITPDLAASFGRETTQGALVTDLVADGPAAKAGIQVGDIITSLNGDPITRIKDLARITSTLTIGAPVDITIVRDGTEQTLSLNVEQQEETSPKTAEKAIELGMQVQELSPETARHLGYTDSMEGVIVNQVLPGSIAGEAGLQRGDVIAEVDRTPVKTLKDYYSLLKEASVEEGILLLVFRGKNSLYVALGGSSD